jgi:hypothetical protein
MTEESNLSNSSAEEAGYLEWSVHPISHNPAKSVFLILFLVLICLLVSISFASIWLGVLSAVLLVGSLRKFFIITRYKLGTENVEVKTPFGHLVKKWDNFKSVYPDNNGVLLSPFPDKSLLENFRGIYLLFPPKEDKIPNPEQVIAFIKQKISQSITSIR